MSDTRPLPFTYQFIAGAVAGISEILMMYPLDVVKTRMQLQVNKPTGAIGEQYSGVFDCIKKIVKTEGPTRLYRGISAPIMMEAPKRATKFATNDEFGKFYKKLFGMNEINQPLAILNGASAGACESFVVVPFELVKIRLQDKTSKYTGAIDVVRKVIQQEGILRMYNGLEATLWRHVTWNAAYFGSIFQIRQLMPKYEDKTKRMLVDLVSGCIGGITGTVLNIPFDVVKTRVQNQVQVPGAKLKYNWAWPALATIYKEEGAGALTKGLLPKVMRLGPGGGVLLVVFTKTMDFFRGHYYQDGKKPETPKRLD
ncbi:mitochondrial 2-oxodicarboxylate carrier [Saccharomycopsis crataegensis]|uniref:Mitochondrial 2-oxodicarboxylate carrier n=1 Tax=Saccharomycopsis crataegensis TaxID=43959 RepID=A0AAV5QKD2_9ASCO|nr:mitochondrial 2-oxodicarboxylate carrier [Saccharomycopsis crataegensis]